MTMAEANDPVGYQSSYQQHQQNNNSCSHITNSSLLWRQRKRRRLSAVLDKLHNNNVVHNNNQGEISCKTPCTFARNSSCEDSEDVSKSYRPEISVSPLPLVEIEDNQLHVDIQTDESSSLYHKYFSIPSPLFGYYLHTKYLNDVFRKHNELYPSPVQQQQQQQQSHQQNSPLQLQHSRKHSDSEQQYYEMKLQSPLISQLNQESQYQENLKINCVTPPQEQPLDLSVKAKTASPTNELEHYQREKVLSHKTVGVPVMKGDASALSTTESVAWRYNLDVFPVFEEMPPGSDVAYVCPICGQMFSLHDRLAKHIASRHKSKKSSSDIAKAYICEVCNRPFARSDMLTRHTRLHTGVKPYTCKVCGQVFSRSDHLSTHQRTHTGEKPYKCPHCPYAACRRDMITRHMRTHTRYDAQRNTFESKSNVFPNVKVNIPMLVKQENFIDQKSTTLSDVSMNLPLIVKTESS